MAATASPQPLEQLAKRITSWRVILAAIGSLLALGVGGGLFSQRFARASKFEEHVDEERTARARLSERVGKVEAVEGYIHDDLERVLEQERENARVIGARVVDRPDHERQAWTPTR
jgi:hypothetical protein